MISFVFDADIVSTFAEKEEITALINGIETKDNVVIVNKDAIMQDG